MQLKTLFFASTAIVFSAIFYNMSALTQKQKALFLESKQGSFVLGTRDIPKPKPGELLVKVLATSLNPVDWKIQKYGVFITEYPAILGTDIAGEVQEVGEGVATFSKGDRMYVKLVFFVTYTGLLFAVYAKEHLRAITQASSSIQSPPLPRRQK